MVKCNKITGTLADADPASLWHKEAISFNNSISNKIENNRLDKVYYGMLFYSNCLMTNSIGTNYFYKMNIGIYGFSSSVIGDQLRYKPFATYTPYELPANQFFDFPSMLHTIDFSGTPFKYTFSSAAPKTIPNSPSSLVIPTALSDPAYMLDAVITPPLITTLYPENQLCNANPLARMADTSSILITDTSGTSNPQQYARMVVSNEIEYALDEEGLQKIDEENVYHIIKSDSILLDDDSLVSFLHDKESMHTGQLYEIKENIANESYIEASTKLLRLSQDNYAEESNEKVFAIYNDFMSRDTPNYTALELEQLLEIANYCPIRHGAAVFVARTILNTQVGYENMYWQDEDLCISGITYRRSVPNLATKNLLVAEVYIYPNPSNEVLNYILMENREHKVSVIDRISITDVLGNEVLIAEKRDIKSMGVINTSILPNGIYNIEFSGIELQPVNLKFIINR